MRQIVCQRCQTEFTCNRNGNECWCFKLPYIRLDDTDKYNDCLCEKCLIELYNERSKNNNKG
jgi:hypothetical protein